MKSEHLRHLFNLKSNRCLDVAMDHGFFGELSFLQGIEDMEAAVHTVVEAGPDAIQLTVGQAPLLHKTKAARKPALVLRTDVANVYGTKLPEHLYSLMIGDPVGEAVQLGAHCVVVNLFDIPNQPRLREQCLENILALKPECEKHGIPLMVEPLVMQPNEKAGGYMVDGDINKILPLVRQATELGADIIKADPCDDTAEYHRVVKVARVPVLVRGGGRVSDDEILCRTHVLIQQGAAGIVYGRNVIQHANPTGMVRALMAVVHDHATADDAKKFLQ